MAGILPAGNSLGTQLHQCATTPTAPLSHIRRTSPYLTISHQRHVTLITLSQHHLLQPLVPPEISCG